MKVTAATILELLMQRHGQDIAVPECKTGPTNSGRGHVRLDLWVMKPSWARPNVIGYEIKVSRGDFLHDGKWEKYLPYCNEFYFVCPPDLIDKGELPPEAGLLVTSVNGKRLYTKKKAVRRDVAIPESLYRYLLMWRVQVKHGAEARVGSKEYWEQWLVHRRLDSDFGHRVSFAVAEAVRTSIYSVKRENERLRKQTEKYDSLLSFLDSIGVDPNKYVGTVRNEIQAALRPQLVDIVAKAAALSDALHDMIGAIQGEYLL